MAKDDILYARQRRLLRTRIPLGENLTGLALLLSLAGAVLWVGAQRDRFDPAERDVSAELLLQASRDQTLYNRPPRRWSENPDNAAATIDVAPYPAAVLADGWRASAAPRLFDAGNLYEKINGEAPKFLKQGFRSMVFLRLTAPQGDAEIAVELYDQGDVGGSLGIFSEHLSADNAIETRDGVTFFRTSIGAIGRTGRYFFRIAGDAASETVQQKSVQLALALAALNAAPTAAAAAETTAATTAAVTATVTDEPAGLRRLRDDLGIAAELITFERQNVFQYDFASDFWFGKIAQDDAARLFVHQAASAEDAAALFDLLLEEQRYEYAVLSEDDRRALLRHDYLGNVFAIERRGRSLVGVENAADRAAAETALRRFADAGDD